MATIHTTNFGSLLGGIGGFSDAYRESSAITDYSTSTANSFVIDPFSIARQQQFQVTLNGMVDSFKEIEDKTLLGKLRKEINNWHGNCLREAI